MSATEIPVYAHLDIDEDAGEYRLSTTYKPYFDKVGYMDDGCSNDMFPNDPFDTILDKLTSTDMLLETTDSEWIVLTEDGKRRASTKTETKEAVIARITRAAASVGIGFIFNNAGFDKFLASH